MGSQNCRDLQKGNEGSTLEAPSSPQDSHQRARSVEDNHSGGGIHEAEDFNEGEVNNGNGVYN